MYLKGFHYPNLNFFPIFLIAESKALRDCQLKSFQLRLWTTLRFCFWYCTCYMCSLAAGCIVISDWADFPLNQDLQRHLLYQSCYWHLVAKNNIGLLLATLLSVLWHVRFYVVWGHIFWKYNHLFFRTIFRLVFMLTVEECFLNCATTFSRA